MMRCFFTLIALLGFALAMPTESLAQGTASEQQMRQLQQMVDDPNFQNQLRDIERLMQEQGLPVPPALQGDFFQGMAAYNQCIGNGLGSNWLLSAGDKFQALGQHIERLCQSQRPQAAADFVNDQRNLERFFTTRELAVMEQCVSRFPDQDMLNLASQQPATVEDICTDF